MKSIEIKTECLNLKPLGSEYLVTVNAYAMDYENTKYMCRLPKESEEETVTNILVRLGYTLKMKSGSGRGQL